MSSIAWVVVAIVVVILLFVVVKILKSCLPKIIVGLVILGALAYLAYMYFIK
jgi:hypothetical protein